MRSNVFVETCRFNHVPSTMTFFGERLFYEIRYVSERLIRGFSFLSGSGTNNPLGKFVLLRSRRKAVTCCFKKTKPYS